MKRFLVGLVMLCSASAVHAQWAQLPSGEWSYGFNYTTAVQFVCGFTAPGMCVGGTNSLTINNGSATARITFAGVSGTAIASNVTANGLPIGTFSLSYSGTDPFSWPLPLDAKSLFGIRYQVTETAPAISTGTFIRQYRPISATTVPRNCCEGNVDFLTLGLAAQPPLLHYNAAVMTSFTFPTFTVGGPTEYAATASVGLIPEPSTWALMLAGLGAIGLVRRRRK